jgi:hypothetical protein
MPAAIDVIFVILPSTAIVSSTACLKRISTPFGLARRIAAEPKQHRSNETADDRF